MTEYSCRIVLKMFSNVGFNMKMTQDNWDVELWNESIDGNAMVCGWISDVKAGYNDNKSLLTHCRNINKKLDAVDPHGRYLWARWRV